MRSPQQHVGVVHSSNLCTEITLNTSDTEIAVCNLGSVNLAHHLRRWADRSGEAEEDGRHRDAHARQRDRHQLLRRQEGARLEPAPSAGGPRHHGIPGRAVRAAHALRFARRRGIRRPVDGGGVLPRLLGVDRARCRARALLELPWLAVGPWHPADRLAGPAGQGTRRLCRGRSQQHPRLGRAAHSHRPARHAQLQLRCDRADGNDLQHHRRQRVHRADLRQPVGEVEPVGRVHDHQRVPRARPQEARACGTT